MNRKYILCAHKVGATMTLVILSCFWLATLIAEAYGDQTYITAVKVSIPWGFFILIPAIMMTGITGFKMSGNTKNQVIKAKKRRMPIIAFNGILILIPFALILRNMALNENFHALFWILQAIELIFGALNIILVIANMRAGKALTRYSR
ncbi:hypothetical protein [Bartonella sp. LJL80]